MIQNVSKALCELLREQLYPNVLYDHDSIQLCVPRHEHQDVLIGIYLYDIADYTLTAKHYAHMEGNQRQFPPKLVELSYLIYVHEDAQFGGYNKEHEEVLYERMIQIFHDTAYLEARDYQLSIQFIQMNLDQKMHLWQSLNQPLQPALYLRIAPIEIKSELHEDVNLVRSIDVYAKRYHKGEDSEWDASLQQERL